MIRAATITADQPVSRGMPVSDSVTDYHAYRLIGGTWVEIHPKTEQPLKPETPSLWVKKVAAEP